MGWLVGCSERTTVNHEVGLTQPNDNEALFLKVSDSLRTRRPMSKHLREHSSRRTLFQLAVVKQRHIAIGVLQPGGELKPRVDHRIEFSWRVIR